MSREGGGLGRSTAVMAAGTATSRVLGVVHKSVLVAVLGGMNAAVIDAFAAANWLPNMLYMLIAGGVLNAVLVPQVVRAYRSANGQEYVDRLLTLSGTLLFGLTALLTLAAPLIVWITVRGLDAEFVSLTTVFAFWCIPQVFFYGVYTLLGQVLNARAQFGPYMWAPVVNNVVTISGLVLFAVLFGRQQAEGGAALADWDTPRIAVLAGSATLGVMAQALVLLVPLYRSGFRFRPRWDWRNAGLGTAGRVAGWTFAALAVGQVGIVVVMNVATAAAQSGYEAGVPGNNAYSNAFLIFMLPHSLVTVSLLTALFTRLSDHAAARETRAVRADFSAGLRLIAVFTLIAAAVLSVLALPLVRVVFPTTAPVEAASMAPIIVAFMAGLVALGAWSLCQRVYYAYEDAKGLFRIQVAMAAVVVAGSIAGYLLLAPRWWVAAAAASISASYVLGAVWGGAHVWARLGGGLSRIVRLHVRAGLAAAAATAVGWPVSRLFGDLSSAGLPTALGVCVLVGAVMLGVYLGGLRLLRVGELDELLAPVLARFRRTMSTAADDGGSAPAEAGPEPEDEPRDTGGDRLDSVIGRGTLLAGRYRLHQPISTDLPADCWSARDQILDRPVRALVLRSGNVSAAQDAARRAALVSDPRLLRVLDVGDHEGVAYVVTEPVVGQDIAHLTAHGPLPADQARAIIGEAAAALEVARRRGLHHLALRPSALHITPDGTVLLSGLAMDGELLDHGHAGARATSRADTVGLVALLYLAVTGHWPASAGVPDTEGAAVAPVVAGGPVPPAELSPAVPNDLDTLCTVTLGPNDDGPHSPGELVRELEPWGSIDAQGIYDALDAASRSVTVPSGPWSADGSAARTQVLGAVPGPFVPGGDAAAAAGAGGSGAGTWPHESDAAARTAAAVPEAGPEAGSAAVPEAGSGAEAETGPGAEAEAGDGPGRPEEAERGASAEEPDGTAVLHVPNGNPVARQSVRRTFGERPAAPPRPGTPPPAAPSGYRRPEVSAAAPVRPGVTEQLPRASRPAPRVGSAPQGRPGSIPPRSGRDFDAIVARNDRRRSRGIDPAPIVLAIVALAVVIGLVLAWRSLTAPAPPIGGEVGLTFDEDLQNPRPEPPPDEAEEPEDETPAEPVTPVIASAQMIDPPPDGDENEHPEAVDRAIDGDLDTFWYSRTYVSPTYGMKDGIGYAVTLAEPATVSTVRLFVNGSGGRVEIRATDPGSPTEGEPLATGSFQGEREFTFDPVEARHIVLWITELPQTPDGSNRIELLEIEVE